MSMTVEESKARNDKWISEGGWLQKEELPEFLTVAEKDLLLRQLWRDYQIRKKRDQTFEQAGFWQRLRLLLNLQKQESSK